MIRDGRQFDKKTKRLMRRVDEQLDPKLYYLLFKLYKLMSSFQFITKKVALNIYLL